MSIKITPQKKARNIVTDFVGTTNNFDSGKKCALIHVNTIIDLLSLKKLETKKSIELLGFYLVVRYEIEKIDTPF